MKPDIPLLDKTLSVVAKTVDLLRQYTDTYSTLM